MNCVVNSTFPAFPFCLAFPYVFFSLGELPAAAPEAAHVAQSPSDNVNTNQNPDDANGEDVVVVPESVEFADGESQPKKVRFLEFVLCSNAIH